MFRKPEKKQLGTSRRFPKLFAWPWFNAQNGPACSHCLLVHFSGSAADRRTRASNMVRRWRPPARYFYVVVNTNPKTRKSCEPTCGSMVRGTVVFPAHQGSNLGARIYSWIYFRISSNAHSVEEGVPVDDEVPTVTS